MRAKYERMAETVDDFQPFSNDQKSIRSLSFVKKKKGKRRFFTSLKRPSDVSPDLRKDEEHSVGEITIMSDRQAALDRSIDTVLNNTKIIESREELCVEHGSIDVSSCQPSWELQHDIEDELILINSFSEVTVTDDCKRHDPMNLVPQNTIEMDDAEVEDSVSPFLTGIQEKSMGDNVEVEIVQNSSMNIQPLKIQALEYEKSFHDGSDSEDGDMMQISTINFNQSRKEIDTAAETFHNSDETADTQSSVANGDTYDAVVLPLTENTSVPFDRRTSIESISLADDQEINELTNGHLITAIKQVDNEIKEDVADALISLHSDFCANEIANASTSHMRKPPADIVIPLETKISKMEGSHLSKSTTDEMSGHPDEKIDKNKNSPYFPFFWRSHPDRGDYSNNSLSPIYRKTTSNKQPNSPSSVVFESNLYLTGNSQGGERFQNTKRQNSFPHFPEKTSSFSSSDEAWTSPSASQDWSFPSHAGWGRTSNIIEETVSRFLPDRNTLTRVIKQKISS